jgi:hypothetical protein
MSFNTKDDLLNYVNNANSINEINTIVDKLYFFKRTGRLCKYNLTNEEINFIEQKFGVYLKDYHNFELNINDELNNILKDPTLSKYFNIVNYINERKEYLKNKYDEDLLLKIKNILISKNK